MTLLAFISSTLLTKVAIFGFAAVFAWWLLEFFVAAKSRAEERLDEIREPNSRKTDRDDRAVKKAAAMTKVLERASPALARPLMSKDAAEANKLKTKLAHAGFRSEAASSIFLGLKLICAVFGLIAGGGSIWFWKGNSTNTIMYTIAVAGIAFYVPSVVTWFIARGRKEGIFLGLPDALDLMVVCVEAGLGLDAAMRKVSDEMGRSYPVIAEEFSLCNLQLQMGRPRVDVLHELGMRTGVDDLRALAAILIQADKFGSSIAQALRVQSNAMRIRRRQLAEERAAKTAVKLIFPLVIFIFPAIFVVLVGPAAITMINEMFPAMQSAQ